MKKVLMCSTNSFDLDGITNVIFNLYRNMDNSIIHMDFVANNSCTEKFRDEIEKNGSKLFVLTRNIKRPLDYINRFRKIAKGYDVVHVNGNSATMVLEMLGARLAGVHLRVAHCHTTKCRYKLIDKLSRPFFYKLCNGRLACGFDAGKYLYSNLPFLVIQNGIETLRFKYDKESRIHTKAKLGWEKEKIIINVGNFYKTKNQVFIIEIFKELVMADNSYRLLLVGDGKMRDEIESCIKTNNLEMYIRLTGAVNNIVDYLNASDLVLMPSLYEGLPLSLIEEQANGIHCFVSDVITKEVDKTGHLHYISLDKSPKEWATEIINYHLSTNREQDSEDSIQSIKNAGFDIKNSTDKLVKFYLNN